MLGHQFSHLILTAPQRGNYSHYPHFTDVETGLWRLSNQFTVTGPVVTRVRRYNFQILPSPALSRSPHLRSPSPSPVILSCVMPDFPGPAEPEEEPAPPCLQSTGRDPMAGVGTSSEAGTDCRLCVHSKHPGVGCTGPPLPPDGPPRSHREAPPHPPPPRPPLQAEPPRPSPRRYPAARPERLHASGAQRAPAAVHQHPARLARRHPAPPARRPRLRVSAAQRRAPRPGPARPSAHPAKRARAVAAPRVPPAAAA